MKSFGRRSLVISRCCEAVDVKSLVGGRWCAVVGARSVAVKCLVVSR